MPPNQRKRRITLVLAASVLSLAALLAGCAVPTEPVIVPAQPGPDPLFVNLTTDEPHRALMGVTFAKNQQELGHPVTIFLNDRGVLVGSQANATQFEEQQKILAAIMAQGGTVLICPMCSKHYGVEETDILPGLQVGNPQLTGENLFKDNTKTLTW